MLYFGLSHIKLYTHHIRTNIDLFRWTLRIHTGHISSLLSKPRKMFIPYVLLSHYILTYPIQYHSTHSFCNSSFRTFSISVGRTLLTLFPACCLYICVRNHPTHVLMVLVVIVHKVYGCTTLLHFFQREQEMRMGELGPRGAINMGGRVIMMTQH